MQMRRVLFCLLVTVLVTSGAFADTKVVQKTHTDGFSMMGQQQPAKDEENVMWLGDGRLRVDQTESSIIIRSDLKKMWVVQHSDKKYFELDLPIDASKLLPPEMAGQMQQMMSMMQFTATVTPSEETKTVGQWKARRYDVTMSSAMVQMKMQVWATKEVSLDSAAFNTLYEQTKLLQLGMDQVVQEMRKIDGFQVASDGVMTMMKTEVKTSSRVVSIEDATAPANTYEPPAGYAKEQFDLFKMQKMGK
jgi:hypothetical protein